MEQEDTEERVRGRLQTQALLHLLLMVIVRLHLHLTTNHLLNRLHNRSILRIPGRARLLNNNLLLNRNRIRNLNHHRPRDHNKNHNLLLKLLPRLLRQNLNLNDRKHHPTRKLNHQNPRSHPGRRLGRR